MQKKHIFPECTAHDMPEKRFSEPKQREGHDRRASIPSPDAHTRLADGAHTLASRAEAQHPLSQKRRTERCKAEREDQTDRHATTTMQACHCMVMFAGGSPAPQAIRTGLNPGTKQLARTSEIPYCPKLSHRSLFVSLSSGRVTVMPTPTPPFSPEQITALFIEAARSGDQEMLGQFLDAGMIINAIDGRGYTALLVAAYNGQAQTVRLLLERGADPDIPDLEGASALAGVAFKGHVDIARMLIDSDATIDHANHAGRTPLMFAFMFERREMARLLLDHGASADVCDGDGLCVRDIAEKQGMSDLIPALSVPLSATTPPASSSSTSRPTEWTSSREQTP